MTQKICMFHFNTREKEMSHSHLNHILQWRSETCVFPPHRSTGEGVSQGREWAKEHSFISGNQSLYYYVVSSPQTSLTDCHWVHQYTSDSQSTFHPPAMEQTGHIQQMTGWISLLNRLLTITIQRECTDLIHDCSTWRKPSILLKQQQVVPAQSLEGLSQPTQKLVKCLHKACE